MTNTGANDDQISDETRMMAAEVRGRAGEMPTAAEISDLAADVLTAADDEMTQAQIRAIVREAHANSQRMTYLLGILAGRFDGPGDACPPEGP